MTPTELNDIKQRLAKATPGEWLFPFKGDIASDIDETGNIKRICTPTHIRKEDGDFIAHSKSDIANLLKLVDELRSQLNEKG